MLQIYKGESKNWYLTLTEKVTVSPVYFLFNFKHRLTDTQYNVILTDISSYPDRYNKFAVVEGTSFDIYSGEYLYRVYAQTSASNTDPDLADELVEEGILKVNLTSSPEIFYSPS